MAAKEIASAAIAKFNEKITDEIFLTIQNDKDLMREYLRAISDSNLDTVNMTIGKAVKAAYGLTDNGESGKPKSTLIKSFMTYKPK